jgi:hypothetical protein
MGSVADFLPARAKPLSFGKQPWRNGDERTTFIAANDVLRGGNCRGVRRLGLGLDFDNRRWVCDGVYAVRMIDGSVGCAMRLN